MTPLSLSSISSSLFSFLFYRKHHIAPPLILLQIKLLSLQIRTPEHSVYQYPCSRLVFLKDSPHQVSKTTHFFKTNF